MSTYSQNMNQVVFLKHLKTLEILFTIHIELSVLNSPFRGKLSSFYFVSKRGYDVHMMVNESLAA